MANLPTLMGQASTAMGTEMRTFLGGMLHQEPDRVIGGARALAVRDPDPDPDPTTSDLRASDLRVVTKRQPTAEEWTALRFAWRVCAHVKSNTIVFTGADRTLAVGAGQMSRVDSVKVAVMKAGAGIAEGQRRGVRRVLSVPRRARRRRRRRRHRGRAAGRIGQGRRGDCRRRRARPGDGLYGAPPFPPLTSFRLKAEATCRLLLRRSAALSSAAPSTSSRSATPPSGTRTRRSTSRRRAR